VTLKKKRVTIKEWSQEVRRNKKVRKKKTLILSSFSLSVRSTKNFLYPFDSFPPPLFCAKDAKDPLDYEEIRGVLMILGDY